MSLYETTLQNSLSSPKAELPAKLRYSKIRPLGFGGRTATISVMPAAGRSFRPSQQIEFQISSANGWLDVKSTYLQFTIRVAYQAAADAAARAKSEMFLDCSAFSAFSQLQINSGAGDLLENIDNWNYLVNLAAHVQISSSERDQAAMSLQGWNQPRFVRAGLGAGNVDLTFAIPFYMSGLIGPSASHDFPLCLSPISVFLTVADKFMLGSATAADLCPGMAGVTIENPRIFAAVTQFDDIAIPKMLQALVLENQTPLFLSTTSYRAVPQATLTAAGQQTLQITDKLKSVRALIGTCVSRDTAINESCFSSVNPGISGVQLLSNASYWPHQPTQNDVELLSETLKAFGEFGSLLHKSGTSLARWKANSVRGYVRDPAIANANAAAVGVAAGAPLPIAVQPYYVRSDEDGVILQTSTDGEDRVQKPNGFCFGIDLEATSHADGLICGLNTILSQPTTLYYTAGAAPAGGDARVMCWLNYDTLISFSPDGRTVRMM